MQKKVATAGYKEISSEEFLQRYEFTPFTGKQNKKAIEQNKLNFLYTLISEKLWALEAENEGLDTAEVIRFASEQFSKMFARDAMFTKEIKNKVSISEEELSEGLLRQQSKLNIRFLFSESENEIRGLHKLLISGVDFDSILVEREEYSEQTLPMEIVYGQMDWAVEDSLYNLNAGDYTTPIYTPEGWYIFKLVNRSENLMSEPDQTEEIKSVNKILTARKVTVLYDEFYTAFFKDKKIDVNARLARVLLEKLKEIIEEKYRLRGVKDDNLISLTAAEVIKLEESIGSEDLSAVYMEIEGKPYSLKYFIRLLAFDGFNIKPGEIKFIPSIINQRNRTVIERELLASYAYSKNYQMLPEVLQDVNIWKNNYLSQLMRSRFDDSVSVSNEEALEFYTRQKKEADYPPLVNIIEVYNDDAAVIEEVVSKLKSGTDIRTLALQYSKRESTKKNNGESGLTSVYQLGEIGRITLNMEPGEIFGPVAINNGYSIFKLIEKKTGYNENRSFESLKDEITRHLMSQKLKRKFQDFTTYLAGKYGFNVDEDALREIEVTNINSVAFRNLGFGGKITAVPLVAPDFNWIYDYTEKEYLP